MKAQKGYYSLIQFCPDRSRLEAVNVGVLLFCPDPHFIAARTAKGNQRPTKLVGRSAYDAAGLNAAKRAIERRLENDAKAFQTLDDLQHFVDSRGNDLKLTTPRPIKVFDPTADLHKLFKELVGGQHRIVKSEPVCPELDVLFKRLQKEGRARLNLDLDVPLLGRRFHVPYAFDNAMLNLVKPHRFASEPKPALDAAMRLAIEGDQLFKLGKNQDEPTKLVVVAVFEQNAGADDQLGKRVDEVLRAYNAEAVLNDQFAAFVAHIEQTAHLTQ